MKSKGIRSLTILIAIVVSALALVSTRVTRRVSAATVTVSNLNDSGPGSLRQAVLDAAPSGGDTIVFSVSGTITLTTGEITIDKGLRISGPGAQSLTISGNNTSRVFNVLQGAVTISGLTISKGNGQGAGIRAGGGILNSTALTLISCIVSDCSVFGDAVFPIGLGGGIFNNGPASLTVTNSTLSGNSADNGGGLFNESSESVVVTSSTISKNRADPGGGIYNDLAASISVSNSTISDNLGGGILNVGTGTLNVTNSTISGNSSPNAGGGGGIADFGSSSISDSTICGNRSGEGGSGGFLALGSPPVIVNTIVALNTQSFGAPDVNGTFNSQGHNLIGIIDGGAGFSAAGDQAGTSDSPLDPLFELDGSGKPLLRDNGGPTPTIGLRYGSPAIDAGDPSSTLTVDQRGFTRPADGDGDGAARIDIGAFEVQREADLLVSLGADKTSVRQGDLLTYTVTVRNFGRGAAQNVVVNDQLSSGTTFVSAMANKGHFTAPPSAQTGIVTWYLDNLLIGDQEAALIQVTVIVRGKTTITNTASAASAIPDPNMTNNNSSITVSVASGGKK